MNSDDDDDSDDGGGDDAIDGHNDNGDDGHVDDFHHALPCRPNLYTNIDCRPSETEMTRLLVFNVSEVEFILLANVGI